MDDLQTVTLRTRKTDLAFSVLVLALAIRTFLVLPAHVPTASMAPTLVPGDRILVDRISLNFRRPRLGECAVLLRTRMPVQPRGLPPAGVLVKRLAGRPGDRVQLRDDGQLIINGTEARQLAKPFARLYGEGGQGRGEMASFQGYWNQRQIPPGDGPDEIAPLFPDAQTALRVRPGHVFVLGDYSAASLDSRSWGDLPQTAILGLARSSFGQDL